MLDSIKVEDLEEFEEGLFEYIDQSYPAIFKDIRDNEVITDQNKLEEVIKGYIDIFNSSYHAEVD